jgi:hypothetical protein
MVLGSMVILVYDTIAPYHSDSGACAGLQFKRFEYIYIYIFFVKEEDRDEDLFFEILLGLSKI